MKENPKLDFDASQGRVIPPEPSPRGAAVATTPGPPFRPPPMALTLRHQLSRIIVLLEALLKMPSVPITEGICGAVASLLAINTIVRQHSTVLESLDIVGCALDWISRLAAKICRGNCTCTPGARSLMTNSPGVCFGFCSQHLQHLCCIVWD